MRFIKPWFCKFICMIALLGADVVFAKPFLITLDIVHVNLADAVRLFAKFLKINAVVSSNVSGEATLHLNNADPMAAFRLLLLSEGLLAFESGGVWLIAPRDELLKRKEADDKWQNLLEVSAPLVTYTKQVQYARADDIARLIQEDHASLLSKRGSVRVDARTNMVYIQDISDRILPLKTLLQRLDVPVKQVQIKARLASVDSSVEKTLGVHFGVSAPGVTNVSPGQYSVAVAHLPDGSSLDIKLSALESEGRAELISSPQLFTANLQTANIEAGEEVPYQEVSESGGTAIAFKKAVLGLKVTPQVLPGDKVLLQLEINQDRPSHQLVLGMPTIATRKIKTTVLIKAGQTIVLGGIYEDNRETGEERIPFLSQVPVFGYLFQDHTMTKTKRELLIFITPTISDKT